MRPWLVVGCLILLNTAAANPDSINQPVVDGCGRDPGQLIAGTSPQWVYVNKDNTPQFIIGTAEDAYPTYTDLFRSHDSYDMNVFFRPDPDFEHLLGTANLGEDLEFGTEPGTMEIEWEQQAFPMFAWPTQGDRMEIMGSWIWDCGHWRESDFTDPTYFAPGTQIGEPVTGERTEIHPPRMVIVHRQGPTTVDNQGTVVDAFISSEGTVARAIQESFAGNCNELDPQDCPRWHPVNDQDYQFEIEAPPRPEGAELIRWQIEDRGSDNAPEPIVNVTATGVSVRVPFNGWGVDGDPMVFAKTFTVTWDEGRPTQHFRVDFTSFEYTTQLDGMVPFQCLPEALGQFCSGEAQESQPPDEVNLYLDVAGQWAEVMAPELGALTLGDRIDLDLSFDLYLADDVPWRLFARGRECDQPMMIECASETEFGLNDDAGIGQHDYLGIPADGNYTLEGTSKMCESSTGSACFRLDYTITDLGAAGPPPPPPPAATVDEAPPPVVKPDQKSSAPFLVPALLLGATAACRRNRGRSKAR